MKFKITWATGLQEVVEQSDCATVEALANTMFGTDYAAVQANGATIELVGEEDAPDEVYESYEEAAAETDKAAAETNQDDDEKLIGIAGSAPGQLPENFTSVADDSVAEPQNIHSGEVGDARAVLGDDPV